MAIHHDDITPGLTVQVMTPHPEGHLKAPWLHVWSGLVTINSQDLTRGAGDALRALAAEVDAAWAEMDRRALAPEVNNPQEDSAMDALESRTPVCPLTSALDMVRPPRED
jgi:hypothetical protein